MKDVIAYVDANRARFVDDLVEWVRIPSISSDPAHAPDMAKNAEHLAATLRDLGAARVEVWPTAGHPAVFAEWLGAPGKPTLLVYGHHRTVGHLPINLRMIVEGEEEVGSANLDLLLRDHAADLAADFVCVSDTAMFGRGIPSLCVGLRGLAYIEVFVDGPALDLHSGSFGGGVANPVNALARMLATLHDPEGRVLVEGFYDHVLPLKEEERREIQSLPFDETAWLHSTGAPALFGEKGYSTLERIWARPTLDVCGISGGFQGAGAKTIIPARASAKVSCRLVPDQEPDEIAGKLTAHFARVAPPGVRVRVENLHGGRPYLAPTDHPVNEVAKRAFTKAFGKPTVFMREGGSIPFVRTIADATGKPCLLMGFGQPDENAHAPNEWLDLENYHLGIKSAAYLYDELGRMGDP